MISGRNHLKLGQSAVSRAPLVRIALVILAAWLNPSLARAGFGEFVHTTTSSNFSDIIYWSVGPDSRHLPEGLWDRSLSVVQVGGPDSTVWRFTTTAQHLSSGPGDPPGPLLSRSNDFDISQEEQSISSILGLHGSAMDRIGVWAIPQSPLFYVLSFGGQHLEAFRMNIARSGTNLTLNWSGGTPPFRLERATSLAPTNWSTVLTTNGTNAVLSMDINPAFYRVWGQ